MATIAEIIAAKKAAAATSKPPAPVVAQPLAEDQELTEAIDRIDPPGKRRAGLVLSAKTPLPPAIVAEKLAYAEMRSLSQPQGEAIPVLPTLADNPTIAWHEALNAFESELCMMRDPADLERGWLALRMPGQALPLLLKSFSLYAHPDMARADNEPF